VALNPPEREGEEKGGECSETGPIIIGPEKKKERVRGWASMNNSLLKKGGGGEKRGVRCKCFP